MVDGGRLLAILANCLLLGLQGDTQSGRVSRGDVAAVCVAALTGERAT